MRKVIHGARDHWDIYHDRMCHLRWVLRLRHVSCSEEVGQSSSILPSGVDLRHLSDPSDSLSLCHESKTMTQHAACMSRAV